MFLKMYDFLERRIILACSTALLFYIQFSQTHAGDIPCIPRAGDPGQGKVCVCNSSYCDILERPSRLPKGQFYRYSTSNSTPGFTRSTGSFSVSDTSSSDNGVAFTINTSVHFQEILGFGGAFTDSVGIALTSLQKEAAENLLKSYFGTSGIEYTFIRIPIGGSDFSSRFYSYDDDWLDDIDLKHFNLTIDDYSFKIPFIRRATKLSMRGIRLMSCTWNAPNWMKTSENHSAGFISSKCQKTWAKYHIRPVQFLEEYKSQGLNFWAISGGNQLLVPLLFMNRVAPMSGVIFTATSQRMWFSRHLIPALKASHFAGVKLLAMDDMRVFAPYWMKRMAADPEAFQHVTGIALHWYFDFISSPTILDQLHHTYPDKLILNTESSINGFVFRVTLDKLKPIELGSWERAQTYIYNIMENLDHWSNAYIDWNLALDLSSKPYLNIPLDAAILVNKTSGEFYKQPMFYGIGHFSKFIPPGSKRVEVKSNISLPLNSTSDSFHKQTTTPSIVPPIVKCLATVNPDGSRTLVLFNAKNENTRVVLKDLEQGTISVEVEAKSINTFVYWT